MMEQKIEKKLLKWFGHSTRLDENMPKRKELRVALMQSKRSQGRPKLTWIEMIGAITNNKFDMGRGKSPGKRSRKLD